MKLLLNMTAQTGDLENENAFATIQSTIKTKS